MRYLIVFLAATILLMASCAGSQHVCPTYQNSGIKYHHHQPNNSHHH